jgi:hypothetical protein
MITLRGWNYFVRLYRPRAEILRHVEIPRGATGALGAVRADRANRTNLPGRALCADKKLAGNLLKTSALIASPSHRHRKDVDAPTLRQHGRGVRPAEKVAEPNAGLGTTRTSRCPL